MRPMNVINKLNESDNRTEIEAFADRLCDLIYDAGLDCMRNGDLLIVLGDNEKGTASMNVQFYEGGNNYSDYEVNYIGLGGDTTDEITVAPLAKSGWEQENGDPRGITFEDGHECWAEACPLSNTSPEEVAEIIEKSFEAISKTNECAITEADEETDPVLDKTIKVYDINALIDKEINPDSDIQYRAFDFDGGAAIIVKSDGSGCIADYEGVGYTFDSTSEEKPVYICPKDEDDGNGHRTIHIMATASFKASVDELLKAPSKEMKVKDFFTKYKYNDRCARNFDEIKHYIEDLKESAKLEESNNGYKYIDDSEMDDCIYNSMSNTDVIEILTELQRYFDESVVSIEDVNKNATHDTGMSQADIDACKLGSKNIQEIISALEKAWE